MNRKKQNSGNNPVVRASEINEENFSDMAERVIDSYGYNIRITSTKIRQFLTLINKIIADTNMHEDELESAEIGQLQYLKTRFAYEAGRNKKKNETTAVEEFIYKADILNFIEKITDSRSKEDLELFSKYYESLVAFHKFKGGE